jgi:hypothetical protein
MMSRQAWKVAFDYVEVLLGVWLFFSPWVLAPAAAMYSILAMTILGFVIAADGVWALAKPAMRSPEWVMVVLALAVIFSPWALGLLDQTTVAWNAWIVGAALLVIAGLTFLAKFEGKSETTKMAH